jgi:HAE1 family hydrophobic/amphiphilic exporter-1
VSQLLTLYTTPVVYLYLDRLQVWLRGGKHAPRSELTPEPQLIRAEAAE